jgi:succinate dehydrogenase / fumarate reductase cytochrome b subunit
VFEGPTKLNAYGAFLHSIGEFLWPVRIILLIAVTLHIVATVQLALRKKRARPIEYSVKKAIASSYASRTMYWSGPIVLAFIIFHLLHLTAGYIHPGAAYIEGDVYHNVVSGFQVWWVSLSYVVAISLLGLHLRHGLWSMFQSLGIHQPQHTARLKTTAMVIAVLIVLGYISIPISVLLGLVK